MSDVLTALAKADSWDGTHPILIECTALLVGFPQPAAYVKYKNWQAITYAREYCGKRANSCGLFLDDARGTDCAHFAAHFLAAGGIAIRNSDPATAFCPQGLAVRNTVLVLALRELDRQYTNVTEIGLSDAIVGDVGFLNRIDRPSHAFMVNEPVNMADPLKPVKVYAHTTNRCGEPMDAAFRQWFATLFRLTDG